MGISLLLTLVALRPAEGQARFVYGIAGSAYQSPESFSTPGGLGPLIGIERALSEGMSLSAIASTLHTIRTSDDVSICRPAPGDGCLPPLLYPLWLHAVEIQATVAPVPRLPVRLIGSAGLSLAHDAREHWRGAPRTPNDAEGQSIWRGGFEVRFGRSPRAARLQYTQTSFGADPFAVSSLKTISLVLIR